MKPSPRFTFALIAGDLGCVILAFNCVAMLRGIISFEAPLLAPLLVPAFLLIAAIALIDGYRAQTDYLSIDYASEHLLAVLLATFGTLLVTYVVITSGFVLQQSRLVTGLAFLLIAPLGLGLRRFLALRRAAVHRHRPVIFVGEEADARDFAAECARTHSDRPIVSARLEDEAASPELPSLTGLVSRIEAGQLLPEAIVLRESSVNLPAGLPDRLVRLHFAGVPTYTLERYHEQVWRKIPLYRINPVWLFQGGFQLARNPFFERAKRVSDLFLASIGLLLAAPFLLLAALFIWFGDGGPVLFHQTRIGVHRHPFRLYKLRTMRVAPAASSEGRYTAKGDARITRVGRLLRVTRLDEFPQLWNVIRGEMSMIGPRAEWDTLVADYEKQIPCYHFRHLVRPGITGWAQVNYPYGANLEDTLRKLEYDLYYIRHYSFRLDAAIVLKTLHVMLTAKGGR